MNETNCEREDPDIAKLMSMEVYICIMKVSIFKEYIEEDIEESKYDYYVLCGRDGGVMGFETMKKGIDHFDKAYESAFKRGGGAVTGATFTHVAMNPSIVHFETQREMLEALFDKPPFMFGEIHSWNYGIKCQKDVSEYWEKGEKPELFKVIK